MINFTSSEEEQNNTGRKKSILTIIIFLEIMTFMSSLSMFTLGLVLLDFDLSKRYLTIGGILLSLVVVSITVLVLINKKTGVFKGIKMGKSSSTRGKTMISTFAFSSLFTNSKPSTSFCKFCGYKINTKDSICPQCGGPIKEK